MLPCGRDEGTALFRLALILEAVAVVECESQDGMETGLSWHLWHSEGKNRSGAHHLLIMPP